MMATGVYIGVDGKPREVKEIYIGVNGKPVKVTEGYIGVNGKPVKFWDGGGGFWNTAKVGDTIQLKVGGGEHKVHCHPSGTAERIQCQLQRDVGDGKEHRWEPDVGIIN